MTPPDAMAQTDALYVGSIAHRRHRPAPHAFRYGLFQTYLDVGRFEETLAPFWFCSTRRFNWLWYRRADYFGPSGLALDAALRAHVAAETGKTHQGPVFMLTSPRFFGFLMNPVTFYYGFDSDGRSLRWILAEITNTPWGERFSYLLTADAAQPADDGYSWRFPKRFHVSPFLPMALEYAWRFNCPGRDLRVHMRVLESDTPQFDAALTLQRRQLTASNLLGQLLKMPVQSLKVAIGIYWNALLIRLRGNPFHAHPKSIHGPH